ncbi:hypothetical protein CPAR01_13914 [Colletotrichum paranaense]|uniref:Uncharacterized protein n=3 Tax=Colletotrichum acutatum species complex TaxID=2707335 RepID=A0AAI9UPL1_9PEZI|nr:uncharacterized protein CPAR01_13914 [Colletotrichum paranaense]XP_060402377.1 uncharacterized protein CABS01_08211 [Colletotrichum abscissum]KAK1462330.1 hypothetical protein CMEL01_14297 [Colletotrichum melonis]KAK1508981.1 hypothetical protein CABS01_08211 [Colletotrichum abscissum]KAK1523061.1 hypothetical protein CPAR01_13914 [Colletotrichum paranaense]
MRCFNAPDSRYKWSLSGYLWSVDCTDTQLSLISGDDGAIFSPSTEHAVVDLLQISVL